MPNSVFMGLPGGNPSGSNMGVPGVGGSSTPAIGGQSNPLIPGYPGGTKAAPPTFPANGPTTDLLGPLTGLNVGGAQGGAGSDWTKEIGKAFHKAGFPSAIADLMANFMSQGAGFNPAVANAMVAALQPQIARGDATIMEQFGSMGLRDSSAAAIGLGDFNSQAVLNEGQILSQMYEQSVSDYMQLMLSGRKPQSQQGGIGSMMGGLLSGSGSAMEGLSALGVGGGAAAAGAGAAAGGGDAMATAIPLLMGLL